MSRSMVLTLGHNSSAVMVEDGAILGGYEEERFSNKKSDSAFPYKSIAELQSRFGQHVDDVCVGHWFTNGIITHNKYIDIPAIYDMSGVIHSIRDGHTHHDSHLLSAQVFAKHYGFPADHTAIVADGFGTFGECITIYSCDASGHRIVNRYFGFHQSLGMLYQYATSYLEMKMHNHEYKMLGYEAHITAVIKDRHLANLDIMIANDARRWIKGLYEDFIKPDYDPIVNIGALAATQEAICNRLDGVLEKLNLTELGIYEKRIVISYYVQGLVERVISSIVELHNPKNLLVVGGLFYNVKLNHRLTDMVDKFCVMPLAGDQGAGLGVYQSIHGDLKWPGHLFWGHRDLSSVEADGIFHAVDSDEALAIATYELDKEGMVNIVRGAMEFGPRSLCNTATLAIPTMDNVEQINTMNDRTTIMPMAPAMTEELANTTLEQCDKVCGSLGYMVVTRNVKPEYSDILEGASHYYKHEERRTCRPQIINKNDRFMNPLIENFGPLINTSFNYHGVPIAYNADAVIYSHNKQRENSDIVTIVVN